jgi:Rieske Fe-S protein
MSDENGPALEPMSRRQRIGPPAEHERQFPVDRLEDRRVSRRELGRLLLPALGGLAAGQAWPAPRSLDGESASDLPARPVAAERDIAVGAAVAFRCPEPDGEPVLLVRLSAERFVAYVQRCSHLSCPVVWEAGRACLRCPCHEGYFDAHTGRPTAGPPRRPLTALRVEVRDGVVLATGRMQAV